jgi:gentisate 1,2-dioxygenase
MTQDTLDRLHEDMERARLVPTWKYVSEFVPVKPKVTYRPYMWDWDEVMVYLRRAGELITPERGAERRSMEHTNPDLRAQFTTSHTIATAVQLVKAGESAPAHRHMAGAIRFAARSKGGDVYTRVDGEPLMMEENDLLLTPSGTWHEHVNNTPHDIVWLDALDYPLVNLLQASWFQPGHGKDLPAHLPAGYSADRLGHQRPAGWSPYGATTPRMRYPWRDMRASLDRLRDAQGSPFDGVLLEYVNPLDGGPTLPTMSCRAQLLRPGEHTRAHRTLSSTVYFVIEGEGCTVIEGTRFEWQRGSVIVVPNWHWHEHQSLGGREAVLFSVTDQPVMEKLGMYREEAYIENGGHQPALSAFSPL